MAQSKRLRETQDARIGLKPWPAEERGRRAQHLGDRVVRLLELHNHVVVGEPREVNVVSRVVADDVPVGSGPLYEIRPLLRTEADHEEGTHAMLAEQVEKRQSLAGRRPDDPSATRSPP
jgi:hypothetical protein